MSKIVEIKKHFVTLATANSKFSKFTKFSELKITLKFKIIH